MASNVQKTPIARTLNTFSERKARAAIELLGKALPASVTAVDGSIVTVKFELTDIPFTIPPVTVPLAGPEYARPPTQVGDKGVVFPADAYLGGVSGLGGGVADLSQRANLSALVFFPIGNKGWTATDNPNAYVIYGPDGVILRSGDSVSKITLTPTGITILVGAISVVVTATNITFNGPVVFNGIATGQTGVIDFGASHIKTTGPVDVGSLASTGDAVAGGKSLETHVHTGVTTGGGDTGPPL